MQDVSADLFPNASSLSISESAPRQSAILHTDSSSVEDVSLQIVNANDRKSWLQLAKRRSRSLKREQGLNDSFRKIFHIEDSLSIILKLCQVESVQTFAKIFPKSVRKAIYKLGEGSFGEVFMLKNTEAEDVVVKIIPVEGEKKYNGAPMTKFDDVLSEIIIGKELSDLHLGKSNCCTSFVQMVSVNSVAVTRGRFPSYFQTKWDKSNKKKHSENDNPSKYYQFPEKITFAPIENLGSQQQWVILQLKYAGCPLEDFVINNWSEGYSILIQIALGLACAENHLEFEHRDLHLGNILVLRSGEEEAKKQETFIVDDVAITIALNGVKATIIDFTFSRINKDNNVVYIDLAKDKALFLGTGDIQFDVYRDMQTHNKDDWESFNPKSNILWLDFLGIRLLDKLTESNVEEDSVQENAFRLLQSEIRESNSCNELIKNVSF